MTQPIQPPCLLAASHRPARVSGVLLALALGLFAPVAGATSICRWIDDQGQTHLSEMVPGPYQATASCTDSQRYELTPAQRQEADQRAAEQARSSRLEAAKQALGAAPSTAQDQTERRPPQVKRPSEAITADTDCPTRWRLYEESMACFGPYRTTRGATKPEAFDQCNDIPSPEVQCGPRSN